MKTQILQLLKRAFFLGLPLALAAGLFAVALAVAAPQPRERFARITTSSDPASRDSGAPSMSADATLIAFHSTSDLLNEGRPAGVYEIWLYDRVAMTYTRVTSATDINRDSWDPHLNAKATMIAFNNDSESRCEPRQ